MINQLQFAVHCFRKHTTTVFAKSATPFSKFVSVLCVFPCFPPNLFPFLVMRSNRKKRFFFLSCLGSHSSMKKQAIRQSRRRAGKRRYSGTTVLHELVSFLPAWKRLIEFSGADNFYSLRRTCSAFSKLPLPAGVQTSSCSPLCYSIVIVAHRVFYRWRLEGHNDALWLQKPAILYPAPLLHTADLDGDDMCIFPCTPSSSSNSTAHPIPGKEFGKRYQSRRRAKHSTHPTHGFPASGWKRPNNRNRQHQQINKYYGVRVRQCKS